jgi:hypothetical protein
MLPLDPVVKQFFGDKSKRDWEIRIRAIANKLAKDVKVRVVEIENRKQIQPFELQMVGASEQQDTYTLDPNISVLFAVARWSEQSSIRDIVLLPRYGDEIPLLAEYFDSPQVLPTLPQLRCRFLLVASAKGKELGRCWVHFTIRDNGRLDVKKGADYLSEQMKALG